MPGPVGPDLRRLTEMIRDIEMRPCAGHEERRWVATGWGRASGAFRHPFQALDRGVVHEWFGVAESAGAARAGVAGPGAWSPPLSILTHLARRAVMESEGVVVWVGRRCQPYPVAMLGEDRDDGLLRRSVFVDPPDDASRLWAIELAVRCTGVAATVADGSRLSMAATRRLQLAAADGGGLVLTARPSSEVKELSAAAVRWLVRREPSESSCPRWMVGLLRCKGLLSSGSAARGADPVTGEGGGSLIVEYSRGACVVAAPADVADRSGASEAQETGAGKRTA